MLFYIKNHFKFVQAYIIFVLSLLPKGLVWFPNSMSTVYELGYQRSILWYQTTKSSVHFSSKFTDLPKVLESIY